MINEEYINRETAKLAKEKGFNWECLGCLNVYEDDSASIGTYELVQNNKLDENQYALPSQSFLQKWLRDIKEVDIEILSYKVDGKRLYEGICINDDFPDTNDYELFDTYEKALEDILKMALKLIP